MFSQLQNLRPSCSVLGIDLGTHNTVVAVWMADRASPEILFIEGGERLFLSYVWFKKDGTFDVGKNAVRNLKQCPQDVCYDAKRMIGHNVNNFMLLQSEYWSFKVISSDGKAVYQLSDGREISPVEVTTHILKFAKKIAENYVGANLQYAVITVPAYFDQHQKQATIDAATRAGLTVLQIETEPTAAAYAFNYDHKRYDDYNLFVFDLGGGNFNVTVMSVENGKYIIKACVGDNNIGGRDFDNFLIKELKTRLEKHGAQNLDSVRSKIRLRVLAEAIKVALTTGDKEVVNCSDFVPEPKGAEGMFEMTRAEFERLSSHLRESLKDACLKAMKAANMSAKDFHIVLPIGGSSRMPMVTQLLNELFPLSQENMFYQSRGLNPDEAVAYGAAIRAAQLSDPNYVDFVSSILPIGIGTNFLDGKYSLIIKAGTNVPTKVKKRYFTTKNNQKCISIDIYEGERILLNKNLKLFSFNVENLPTGFAGDVYVDVTLTLDNNGILGVTYISPTCSDEKTVDYCKEIHPGKPIEQLFKELAINAESVQQKKILIEARLELRSNVETIEKRYQNMKNVPHYKKQIIIENCNEVLDWLNEHPDETLDEDIIDLAKQIERDAKELINMLEAQVEKKRIQINEQRNIYPIVKIQSPYDRTLNPVGMDVGTTRCCVAVNKSEGIELIAIDNESRLMPSYIAYDEKTPKCGSIVCKRMRIKNYFKSTVFDIKRIIGKPLNCIVVDRNWPFEVLEENEKVIIKIMGHANTEKSLFPEEITSSLIKHMKNEAERFQGGRAVYEVVIAVPAAFKQSQIDATIKAGKLAGLEIVHILPEPIAACLTYANKQQIPDNSTVLLVDLGGGTLDACIIKVENGKLKILKSCGDQYLGGRDFDLILMNHFIAVLKDRYKIDLISGSDKAQLLKKYKLMLLCQEIKHDLQSTKSSWLNVNEIDTNFENEITITREEFENLSSVLLLRIKFIILQAIDSIDLNPNHISYVLHAGGGCRMLIIKNLLKSIFPNAQQLSTVDPDWAVAYGATLFSYYLKTANFDDLDYPQDPDSKSQNDLAF